ncbi:NBS-LRR type disease resistance protein [Melia azedarach]|uniref:NBS-LRR type disease resistance protein n=1 Tax=Melia azedarach TaxID=155640 RepID=A0ACC1Y3U1_MELAZ|nr:NBS-LRR type disease resistance protein [Melia azedarach]
MGNLCSFQFGCEALLSHCLDCSVRRAQYVKKLEDNLAALQTEFEELIAARNDVMTKVTTAERQQMERTDRVKVWLSSVQAVESKVSQLQGVESQEIEKLCFGGYCSKNCKSSYQFGKRVANTLQEVKDLKGKGDFPEVAKAIPEDPADELPMDPKIVGQQLILNEVWCCLKQSQIGIVGLYGTGGVGKTTLLKQINNSFCDNEGHHFDVVIWTVVSKDHKIMEVQDNIGKKIGLCGESWNAKSPEEKALDIFKILSKKKFVLLLDDIWERVDLIGLGVPPPSTKIESKVVFTTRSFAVCRQMGADREFEVKCLQRKEAWKLFQKNVGRDILNSRPEIPKLAEIVVKECRGLPLALNTVGRAMACKKTLEEWKDAVEVLRTSAFEFPGMGKEVYSLLKFSYDSLPNENIRSCFLYCTLFQEDCRMVKRYLIECWLAEGFLGEYGSRAIDRGYSIIGDLIRACLLEDEGKYVVMHDVVRDMALWIACEIDKEKENFLVQAGVGLSKAPEIEKWEGVKRISLMENRIENLSESPRCPNLRTLFLGFNRLSIITNDFFQFMPCLTVLNLAYNYSLKELPSGISNLVSLQHLELSFTGLVMLPEEMKALANLKYLDLLGTKRLSRFPPKILSSLLMLRTLLLDDCGISAVTAEDSILFNDSESLIEELLCLEHLNVLSITATSAHALQKFSSSHKIQSSCQRLCLRGIEDSKSLSVSAVADMKHLRTLYIRSCDFQVLEIDCDTLQQFHAFQNLHEVEVSFCHELKDITWIVLAPNLKIIEISNCDGMEAIISVEKLVEIQEKWGNTIPFSALESLELSEVPQLKSICPTPLPFSYLKEIVVYGCPKLKKLPLNCNSAKERKIVIKGETCWWKKLQWEDEVSQNKFGSCFEIHEDDCEEEEDDNDHSDDNERQGTSA